MEQAKPASPAQLHDRRFPDESVEYRAARDALLAEEIELRRHTERVAVQRRALPAGGKIPEDYVFHENGGKAVKFSQLFGDKDTLVTYNFMFGPARERPCPSCTSMLSGLDGQDRDIEQRVSLVVIAKSPIERLSAFAKERGWRYLRLVSSAGNSFNRDYYGEAPDGSEWPALNVFTRRDGSIRHFYSSEMLFTPPDPGQDMRDADSMWPLWTVLDFTPGGRGTDWMPKLSYSNK
jgi:predicted dithiol-disulfide oxidoreductase (DUF899 family)